VQDFDSPTGKGHRQGRRQTIALGNATISLRSALALPHSSPKPSACAVTAPPYHLAIDENSRPFAIADPVKASTPER